MSPLSRDATASPLRRAAKICWPLLFIVLGMLIANPPVNFWKTVESPKAQCEAYRVDRLGPPPGLSEDVYDASRLDRLIREPQNTLSNLAYVFAGVAVLLAARKPASLCLGVAAIFLGWGSGMYHASLLPEWRLIDILGVYLVLYLLVLRAAGSLWDSLAMGKPGWLLAIGVWLAATWTGVHRNDVRWFGIKLFDSTYVFVAAVAMGSVLVALAFRRTQDRARFLRAIAVFVASAAVSFTGGIGDRFGGFWANPDGWIQGHAVWHTGGALALMSAYEALATCGGDRSLFEERRLGQDVRSDPTA